MSKKFYKAASLGEPEISDNIAPDDVSSKLKEEDKALAAEFKKQKAERKSRTLQELIDMVQQYWEPRHDRLVVYQDEAERKYKGTDIEIVNLTKPTRGTICAIGPGIPGKEHFMKGMKAGDRVIYGRFSGTEVVMEDYEFVILRESDIYLLDRRNLESVATPENEGAADQP